MNFSDWSKANKEEILGIRSFLETPMSAEPTPRKQQLIDAVGYLARAGHLLSEANGYYRIALVNNWPEEGTAELRKRKAEADSFREEVMRDDLRHMVRALETYIDSARTLLSSDRAELQGQKGEGRSWT